MVESSMNADWHWQGCRRLCTLPGPIHNSLNIAILNIFGSTFRVKLSGRTYYIPVAVIGASQLLTP